MFTTVRHLPVIPVLLSLGSKSVTKSNCHLSTQTTHAFKLKMTTKKAFERLSKNVLPSNYALTFQPNLNKFTFQGDSDITIQTNVATKSITINCMDIHVSTVKYSSEKQRIEQGINICYTKDSETVTFTFPEELAVGKGTLSLKFTGELNDKMKGFYRSKYVHPNGEERFAAVTQFEPTDARMAFPCWDEPALKASFDITMLVPQDRIALSNMPVVKEEKLDNFLKRVKFERSPIMSTYLLAMVVGEYDFVETKDSDGVLVRVYTPLGKKQQGAFALSVAEKTLPFYKDYFNIAYPLPKMDLIAIPDFSSGAMENWGLVTYRETALLVDESNSSTATKQRVALVVGHEIAHQWFGNLVTMEWWTHLWLNEGFASWIEYLCVDHCFPEFDIWTQFASNDLCSALSLDALKNSHPIEVAVGHPSEIDEIFDSISYSKGASVIRMLHNYIGDDLFRKGMHEYLKKHQYSNTFTEDLWSALEEASGKPINSIMSTWTVKMGYPVIKISETVKDDKRILNLRQERFIADGSKEEVTSKWLVPLTFSTSSSGDIKKMVLEKQEDTFTIEGVKPDHPIKLNVGGVGFYRVDYGSGMLDKLLPTIKDLTLPARDRLTLQNDLFALSRAGVAKTTDVLKVAGSFINETNYTVWTTLNSNLTDLLVLYQYTDFSPLFDAFLIKLFSPIMASIGWDVKECEGPLVVMLRSLVIGRLGKCGEKSVVQEAKKRFHAHCNSKDKMNGDLRKSVYGIVLKNGGKEELDLLIKMYKEADLQEEKVRILVSLGSVTSTQLIKQVLEFSISPDVRSQDMVFGIMGVTGSLEGRKMAWSFVKEHWKLINDRLQGGFLLARLVKGTTEDFASQEYANDIEAFFKANPTPSAERNILQSLENIRLNTQQLQRDSEEVQAFLKACN